MADLLEGASGRATARTVARLVRLGDALREHLDEPTRALAAYRNAIAIDPPSKAAAKAGLTALLDVAATRAAAADALAQAMRTTGDVTGVLDLLPARLAEAHDDRTQARAAPRGRPAAPRAQARRGRRARRPRRARSRSRRAIS